MIAPKIKIDVKTTREEDRRDACMNKVICVCIDIAKKKKKGNIIEVKLQRRKRQRVGPVRRARLNGYMFMLAKMTDTDRDG